jgi:low temperature requirement protein LtrA
MGVLMAELIVNTLQLAFFAVCTSAMMFLCAISIFLMVEKLMQGEWKDAATVLIVVAVSGLIVILSVNQIVSLSI